VNIILRSLLIGLLGMILAGCSSLPQSKSGVDIKGDWQVETIDGVAIIEDSETTVKFEAGQSVAGRASCNLYFGTYEINEAGFRSLILVQP
jgi:heat shock protein HslJ